MDRIRAGHELECPTHRREGIFSSSQTFWMASRMRRTELPGMDSSSTCNVFLAYQPHVDTQADILLQCLQSDSAQVLLYTEITLCWDIWLPCKFSSQFYLWIVKTFLLNFTCFYIWILKTFDSRTGVDFKVKSPMTQTDSHHMEFSNPSR